MLDECLSVLAMLLGEGSEGMKYYQVPADLLDDPEALRPWAEKSIAVAAKKKEKRK